VSSTYKIPIVDLRAQYAGIRAEVLAAVDDVLESQQFILGPAVSRFEEQMARYLGCAHAAGVASGSDALLLALMARDIGPGDGVVVTPFTFFHRVVFHNEQDYIVSATGNFSAPSFSHPGLVIKRVPSRSDLGGSWHYEASD